MDLIYVNPVVVPTIPNNPTYEVGLPGMDLYGNGAKPALVKGTFRDLDGWWDPPQSTGKATQRAYQHGSWLDKAFYGSRTLVLKGALIGQTPTAVRDAFEELFGNLSIDELFPIVVQEGDLLRHAMARVDGKPGLDWRGQNVARFDVQFIAPDYRRFGGDGSSPVYGETTGLPSESGGRVRPNTRPSMIDATVVTGIASITNEGTAPAAVTVRIDGPVPRPSVQAGDGQIMWFDLDLAEGEWLDLDFDKRTVMLNGQSSRRGYKRGRWIQFGPGTSTLRFGAASPSPTALMTVRWNPAWK